MKHLFSSGEVLYKKNVKELSEGVLLGETLEYDGVEADYEFICNGSISDNPVNVRFLLSDDELDSVKMKFMFKILMQSDIFLAKWKS